MCSTTYMKESHHDNWTVKMVTSMNSEEQRHIGDEAYKTDPDYYVPLEILHLTEEKKNHLEYSNKRKIKVLSRTRLNCHNNGLNRKNKVQAKTDSTEPPNIKTERQQHEVNKGYSLRERSQSEVNNIMKALNVPQRNNSISEQHMKVILNHYKSSIYLVI